MLSELVLVTDDGAGDVIMRGTIVMANVGCV
jgi:hypothetical protein